MSTRPQLEAIGTPPPATAGDAEVIPAAAARGPLVLEARALTKDFKLSEGLRRTVLSAVRGVSFGLYRSAVVALVGESGSGKSTVARMLAGQERPTAGQILLDGNDVQPYQHSQFRQYKGSVQMIFQDPFASLNSVHTVAYALRRPVILHQRAKNREEIHAELVRLCERVRLTPAEQFLAKYPHELSGGQRQRVAIARALAARPRVLLADEPVSMLDVSIRLEVLDLIDELRSQFELAVLYVTHDIASARYFADDTLVMYAGELVERGTSPSSRHTPTPNCSSPRHRIPTIWPASCDRSQLGCVAPEARCRPRSAAALRRVARSPKIAAGRSRHRCSASTPSALRPAGGSMSRHQTCSTRASRRRRRPSQPDQGACDPSDAALGRSPRRTIGSQSACVACAQCNLHIPVLEERYISNESPIYEEALVRRCLRDGRSSRGRSGLGRRVRRSGRRGFRARRRELHAHDGVLPGTDSG
jgi:peptide/nickel transport system ATP-binding protein